MYSSSPHLRESLVIPQVVHFRSYNALVGLIANVLPYFWVDTLPTYHVVSNMCRLYDFDELCVEIAHRVDKAFAIASIERALDPSPETSFLHFGKLLAGLHI